MGPPPASPDLIDGWYGLRGWRRTWFPKLRCLASGLHQARRKIKDLGFSRSCVCLQGGEVKVGGSGEVGAGNGLQRAGVTLATSTRGKDRGGEPV